MPTVSGVALQRVSLANFRQTVALKFDIKPVREHRREPGIVDGGRGGRRRGERCMEDAPPHHAERAAV